MELGEAAALADTFVTRLTFKLHSLPREPGPVLAHWRKQAGSSLPALKALKETRDHLKHFSVSDADDKASGRTVHLTISALSVHVGKGDCPALNDDRCGIYERRPVACRTVPLHYSKPASTLVSFLDGFVQRPNYACDTGPNAPIIIRNETVVDPVVAAARADAMARAEEDRAWKHEIVNLTRGSDAEGAGLPTFRTIARNADEGGWTTVSMWVAWRIAVRLGVMTQQQFDDACRGQVNLLRGEVRRSIGAEADKFKVMLEEYEQICRAL